MNPSNLFHGSLENLKLISDDVWNVFDYDAEFKDVFANITRRESLLSHRFNSITPTEILSDLQYTVTPENQPLSYQKEPFETIFDGEIFKNQDEVEHDNFSYPDIDKIENAYWSDVRTIGRGRQPDEANVTYNNSFDPRLTFNGLMGTPRGTLVDNLEREILGQNNFCFDVEDVTDLADEYYNKYREYLIQLAGSRKTQKKYKEKIISGQPPNLSAPPPKSFDIKTCWDTEEERRLAQKIGSHWVKNIWKNSDNVPRTDDQKITLGNDTLNDSITHVQMTPSPLPNVQEVRRTPRRQETQMGDTKPTTMPRLKSADDILSTPLRHMWKEVWSSNKTKVPAKSLSPAQQPNQDLKFDLEIVNGSVKILPRTSMSNLKPETKPNDLLHIDTRERVCENVDNQPRGRSTSKASSDTRVFLNEGRYIPVITSARVNKDRTKSLRSESALTQIETTSNLNRGAIHSPPRSPRSRSTFAEGFQRQTASFHPATSNSEILPHYEGTFSGIGFDAKSYQINEEPIEEVEHGDFNSVDDSRNSHLSQQILDYSEGSRIRQKPKEIPTKFFESLKQYGWFDEPVGSTTQTDLKDKQASTWAYDQDCTNPHTIVNDSALRAECQSSKRKLFKTSNPNILDTWDKFLDSRSRSISPTKRQALQNSCFSSQFSSPTGDSPNSSILKNSPEPEKTSSQLNAACEPFVPAHLQILESSPSKPSYQLSVNQTLQQMSPTKAVKTQKTTSTFKPKKQKSVVSETSTHQDTLNTKVTTGPFADDVDQVEDPLKQTDLKESDYELASIIENPQWLYPSYIYRPTDQSNIATTNQNGKSSYSSYASNNQYQDNAPTTPTKSTFHALSQALNPNQHSILLETPTKSACEPFVVTNHRNHESSPGMSPAKMSYLETMKAKQTKVQNLSPNKEAVKKLMQSPEVLVPFIANNDARQAYLVQQKINQLQRQAAESAGNLQQPSSPGTYRGSPQLNQQSSHPQQQQFREQVHRSPQTTRGGVREPIVSPQHNINLFSQKNIHAVPSYPAHSLHFPPPPPPMVRTNPMVPSWPCPPPVSRQMNVNFAFPEPRPRVMPQRYGTPYLTFPTFPSFQTHSRLLHPVFNMNNNSSTNGCAVTDEYSGLLRSASNDSLNSFRDYSEEVAPQPTQPTRSARPIRANPANLIHIPTK